MLFNVSVRAHLSETTVDDLTSSGVYFMQGAVDEEGSTRRRHHLRVQADNCDDAVAGHAPYLGMPRETRMSRTLFAVDELSGFIAAVALVRPTGIEGMSPKSVKKKMKQPSFAAAVSREDMRLGAEELGEDFDGHLAFVIAALEPRAEELGLTGAAAAGNDGVSASPGNVTGGA